ncbi:glycosyl hydrolase family 1, partial [Escherichia coli]|nr:glycosyl hydrolase family 1 [Escherichia coli]
MTKVLIVFHDGDKKSGATASMLDLLTELIKCKDLKIICLIPKYGSLYDELKRLRIKTYVIKYYSGRYSLGSYKGTVWNIIKTLIKQLITFLSFMKIKNRFMNIDVVYTNTSDNYMGLLLSIFLKKKNIFHIREFG